MLSKIADFGKKYRSELLLCLASFALVIISFNAGRMSVLQQHNTATLEIIPPNVQTAQAEQQASIINAMQKTPQDLRVVASKASSSRLYHFSWCSGAKRISEKNKIFFENEATAIAAGYSLAGNCQK